VGSRESKNRGYHSYTEAGLYSCKYIKKEVGQCFG